MGRHHLRILSMLKDADLVFIHDADEKLLADKVREYDVAPSFNVKKDLAKVDAVVLATPTVTHYDYIKNVSQHVKNIFVEKPMVDTFSRASEILDLAKTDDLLIQVGFIERFNPAAQTLHAILEKTERIINVDFTRTSRMSDRITDVDVILDLMIHDIDLALYINGPVDQVYAYGTQNNDMIAYATAVLTHTSGAFSRITASRITEKKTRLIQATCNDMFVDCDLLKKEIFISKQSVCRHLDNDYHVESIEETIPVPPQEALLLELQTFLAACRGEDAVVPDVAAGHQAMGICNRIRECIIGGNNAQPT